MTTFEQWVEVEQARIDISILRDEARTPNFEVAMDAAMNEATRQAQTLMNQLRPKSRARVIYRKRK